MNYIFNQNLTSLPPSATLALTQKARDMRAQGIDVVSLSAGEPDFDTPYLATVTGVRSITSGNTHYSVCGGILPLRERIAKKLTEENGITCSADDIAVMPGGKFAVYASVSALVNPGEDVMVLNPAWVSYIPIVLAVGGNPINVPLDPDTNYKITEEILEKYVTDKTKALIINYPNNPTGCILSVEEAQAIARFILRHNLILVSDEIYETLVYDGLKNCSPACLPEIADRVITINGFSKSAAMTGWRIGYVCASAQIMKVIRGFLQHTVTCLPLFTEEAALVSFDCTHELNLMRESYLERRNYFVNALNSIPGVSCQMPDGAFYAWVHIEKDNKNSDELSEFLLEKALVAAVSGSAYGLSSEKYVRMSFAVSMEDLKKAIERIKAVM